MKFNVNIPGVLDANTWGVKCKLYDRMTVTWVSRAKRSSRPACLENG